MNIFVHMNASVHTSSKEEVKLKAQVKKKHAELKGREREAMNIVYALGQASVADVKAKLADSSSYSATRMLLQRLHKKNLLDATRDGARYIYSARTPKTEAAKTAMHRLLDTFFEGSPALAVSALLGNSPKLTKQEIEELQQLISKAGEHLE